MNPYGTLLRWRRRLYERGIFPADSAPVPVISVGNMTWGGAGKTPLVEWMALHFLSRGEKAAVVSRGYRRRSRGVQVVSDGEKILLDVAASGDEPMVLARHLAGVIVIVSESRIEGAHRAAAMGARIVLLDDGFQHLRLRRNLDIVLLDAGDPFGGGLPPFGRAREPGSALSRADIVVLTGDGHADEKIRRWNRSAPVFHCTFPFDGFRDVAGAAVEASSVARQISIAVCGVGNPDGFGRTLAEAGVAPAARLTFRDHCNYGASDLTRIEAAARAADANLILTTEKDLVKLAGRLSVPPLAAHRQVRMREADFFETARQLLHE